MPRRASAASGVSRSTRRRAAQTAPARAAARTRPAQPGDFQRVKGGMKGSGWFGANLLRKAWGGVKSVGAAAGNVALKAGGQALGRALIGGSGAYSVPWTVTSNSLMTDPNAPAMHSTGEDGARFFHQEMIAVVKSSTSWSSTVFNVNPGLDATFPWLSQIAQNFTQYKISGMVLKYSPTISDSVSSFSSLGSILIAPIMNNGAAPATNQVQMQQTKFCACARPCDAFLVPVECKRSEGAPGILNIRGGAVPTGQSIDNYDHCYIQVATVGQPSANIMLGYLTLSYDVTLLSPIQAGPGSNMNACHYFATAGDNSHPFGTAQTKKYDNIGCSFSSTVMTLPAGVQGNFILSIGHMGSTGTSYAPTFSLGNATQLNYWNVSGSATAVQYSPNATINSAYWSCSIMFTVTDSTLPVTITPSFGGGPTASAVDITLQQAPFTVV